MGFARHLKFTGNVVMGSWNVLWGLRLLMGFWDRLNFQQGFGRILCDDFDGFNGSLKGFLWYLESGRA